MPYRARFLKGAEQDLNALPLPDQEDVLEKIKLLRTFPYMGLAMEESYRGYRALLSSARRYRVIYRVLESSVAEIAYIRHCRRQMRLRLVK